MPIPDNISRHHVIQAINRIDAGDLAVPPLRKSRSYCLEHAGRQFRHFPPKEVIRQANVPANGTELWYFRGGKDRRDANAFCEKRGFNIVACRRAPHH